MDIKRKQMVKCKVCHDQKVIANERIRKTSVCFMCARRIVPKYIPKEQHIKYLLLKGYKNEMLSL
jgi:hypothetical protein